MNRLNRMMASSWYLTRLMAESWQNVHDIRTLQAYEHWMREVRTYHALCRCIRRGYKPVREVDVRRDCTNCAHLRAVFGPNMGFVDTVCDVLDSLPDDYEELIERDACPMWEAVE